MKNTKDLALMDVSKLTLELLDAQRKHVTLKFSKSPEAKKYRKQVARIKTVINSI
jgi:ribosomal protein L29